MVAALWGWLTEQFRTVSDARHVVVCSGYDETGSAWHRVSFQDSDGFFRVQLIPSQAVLRATLEAEHLALARARFGKEWPK